MIQQSFESIVRSLAARTPTPGGGAAAALSAAMGTALVLMVVRFSRGKKANVDREHDLRAAEEALAASLERILPLAERDCRSFDHVSAAYGLPKETDEQRAVRNRAIEEAMLGAMVVPEETLCLVRDVLVTADRIAVCASKSIVSDLGSGAELLRAATEGALLNVRINAAYLQDRRLAETAVARVGGVRAEVLRHYESIHGVVESLL